MLSSTKLYGGALLTMMGQQTRSEALFYYFRIEDHMPDDHLLRLMDRHGDFAFVARDLEGELQPHGPSFD